MVSLSEAGIISTAVEAILYGCSVMMFFFTMWIVLSNRGRRRMNKGMLAASCALFVLSTAEMGVNITRLQEGFLTVGPNLPEGPEQFFGGVSQPTFIIKSVLYNTQTLILDLAVIHRTYVVWQNGWIIVLPVIGWLGLLAAVLGTNIALATANAHAGDVFFVDTGRWITANYSMTLATNLTSTSLLAYRIWSVKRRSSKFFGSSRLSPVLRVVLESGALYSLTITAALITFVTKSNGVYVVLDMISPIISIVFNMIIVRVGLAQTSQTLSGTTAQLGASGQGFGSLSNRRQSREPYGGTSLAIEITQYFETDDPEYHGEVPLDLASATFAEGRAPSTKTVETENASSRYSLPS